MYRLDWALLGILSRSDPIIRACRNDVEVPACYLVFNHLISNILQGLLEFIWTEGCSGQSSNPGPALAIFVTLQQVQILGLFLCMVRLIDLLVFKKNQF